MSDILELIASRHSVRGYTNEALTSEEINALVDAGLMAPTAANKQEFHISVVKGDSDVLKEMNLDLLNGKEPENGFTFYYGAPVVMFISADKDYAWSGLDSGIVVENIHLAAHGMGLGSLIIGCVKGVLLGEKRDYYVKKLDIPENYDYQVAIAIGHSATSKEPHTYDKEAQVSYID